jgi:hypothetical protein
VQFAFHPLRHISTQENIPQKEKFVKCDWPTQIFQHKNFNFKKFQLLTFHMIFSESFLSVKNFLEWKRAFTASLTKHYRAADCGQLDQS